MGLKTWFFLSEVHKSDSKSQATQLSVARLRITQHTFQTDDLYSNWAWLPKRYKPQRAREIATQIRFFCDKKPILFSLLLRTRETRMMSFSCPCRRKWLGMMRASFSNVVDSSFLKFFHSFHGIKISIPKFHFAAPHLVQKSHIFKQLGFVASLIYRKFLS